MPRKKLSPEEINASVLAGDLIAAVFFRAPGNGAPIDGIKVVTENGWFAMRPSGTEDVYTIYLTNTPSLRWSRYLC